MSTLDKNQILQNDHIIRLEEGLYYDPIKDSYYFTEKYPEELGPVSVGLQVTRRCNADCIHCAASGFVQELQTEEMKQVIKKLHEAGTVRISVTGGEPLIRDDLVELLKEIRKFNMASTLSTNGLLLDEAKLDEIKDLLSNIRFSIHGLEETNDYIFQKKGAFNKIMEMVDLSVSKDMHVGVIYSVMRRNIDELIDVARILEKKGVDKLIIFTLIANGRGKDIFDNQFLHVSEIQEVMGELRDIKREQEWNLDVTLVDWRTEGQCMLVTPSGQIYGAPSFREEDRPENIYIMGNVLKDDVKQLWKEYPFRNNYVNYYRNH
jgi:MoaA/NifB/PqqE/SkfB family radical SAM enzyme